MIMNMAVMNFIPRCRRMLGDGTILNRVIVFSTIYGLFEGVSIFALLPAITSLVTGQPVLGLGVTGWIVVLACLAVLGGVANYFQLSRGYSVAMFFIRVAHDMIGNRVATLPLGWFNKPLAGKLSRMVSTELMMAGEIIAHFVSPFISNLVVSLVVLVLTYTWDVRLGITLTVATPFFLLFVALSTKLNKKAKDISEPAEVELSNRIVEFAHCQAALRSCGRSANYSELTTANREWLRAKRKELWLNLAGNVVGNSFSQGIVVTLMFMSAQFAVGGTLQPVEAIAFIGLCLRYTQVLTGITDTAAALEALMAGAAESFMLGDRGPRMLQAYDADGAEVRSRLDIFVKDMGIVTAAAKGVGLSTPVAAAAEQLYLQGARRGLAACDDSSVITVVAPSKAAGPAQTGEEAAS